MSIGDVMSALLLIIILLMMNIVYKLSEEVDKSAIRQTSGTVVPRFGI